MISPTIPPTGFFLPRAAPLHDPGWGHPEHQGRLRSVASAVGKCLPELHGRVEALESGPASLEALVRVHPLGHLDRLEQIAARAGTEGGQQLVGPETPFSGASWQAILDSSGAAIEAVERVARGELHNAFVATRPPGHHASAEVAMGFCA
ncbi:MAG: histone deacetylase family protein, partial [Gemmatimonadota bacterium]